MALGVCLSGCCEENEIVLCQDVEIIVPTSVSVSTTFAGSFSQSPAGESCEHGAFTTFNQSASLLTTPRSGYIASYRSVSPNPIQWDDWATGGPGECVESSRPVYLVTIADVLCGLSGNIFFSASQSLVLGSTDDVGGLGPVAAFAVNNETPSTWNARNGSLMLSSSAVWSGATGPWARCCASGNARSYTPSGTFSGQLVS